MARNRFTIPTQEEVREILSGVAEKWRFLAVMPEISQQVGSTYGFSSGGGSYNSSGANRLSKPNIPDAVCESVDIPPITVDTDQRFGAAKKINVPRFVAVQPITINFYESMNYDVTKYLWAWHTMVVDEKNLFGLPKDYKKDIQVYAFNSLDNNSPVLITEFIECFPTNPVGGLSYGQDNGFLTVSCEFTVDNQKFQFVGGSDQSSSRANSTATRPVTTSNLKAPISA